MNEQNIPNLILDIRNIIYGQHKETTDTLIAMKLQMQRNTDSLIHHEERTSLLHEEVNILKRSLKEDSESKREDQLNIRKDLDKIKSKLDKIEITNETKKKTIKGILITTLNILIGMAQVAAVITVIYLVIGKN